MSETLSLSGVEYIPATLAGKRFGYTNDYIAKLAREGQVVGTKVGHQWFVVEKSVKEFFENKTIEKNERNEATRIQRQQELAEFQKKLFRAKGGVRRHREVNTRAGKRIAVMETLVILIIGLSLGASGYVITSPNNQNASVVSSSYSAIERLAVAVYSFITGGNETDLVEVTSVLTNESISFESTKSPAADSNSSVGTTTHTSMVVAPGEVFTATTVDAVRGSFSDDVSVSVDAKNPDTGIIIPHFRSRDGEEYRFLLVPIDAEPLMKPSVSNANDSITGNKNGG